MRNLLFALSVSLLGFNALAGGGPHDRVETGMICYPNDNSVVKFYSFEFGRTNVWFAGFSRAYKQEGFTTSVAFRNKDFAYQLDLDLKNNKLKGFVALDGRNKMLVDTTVRCEKSKN